MPPREHGQELDGRRVASGCLEAGSDPTLIARSTAEITARRAIAEHRLRRASGTTRLTPSEIHTLVTAIGNLVGVYCAPPTPPTKQRSSGTSASSSPTCKKPTPCFT